MKKSLIIYHIEDNDGLFSMAITYWWLRTVKNVNADNIVILGANYNKLSGMLSAGKFDNMHDMYDKLVITDVSFNEQPEMLKLYQEFGNEFYWFDHHKPIIDYSMTNELHNANGLRDIKHSALYNAWAYCFPDKEMPYYFKILSAYDSFSFDAEGIDKTFATNTNQGTTNKLGLNTKDIISLVKHFIDGISESEEKSIIDKMFGIGKAFNDEQDKIHAKLIDEYGDMSWTVNGRKACAVFVQEQTSSDFFKSIAGKDVKHGIIFKHQKNGNWVMSLYNINIDDHSFHCGDYLKAHYNGGGHEGAAGCTLSLEQYIEILKNKKI